ncbi:hypothetical protein LCGC14_1274770 [marine sediment metagenome]|uniref:AAA+ ATPase domain-containing protein n=1 Tax=marine sediment metagenome TaxID=412755 RepID=A0A0F9LI83_9ZZZZ
MEFTLRPAERGEVYGRCLFFAESGHGKTYSALAVAFHLAELYGIPPSSIAVIDTETVASADRKDAGKGSAEKYEGRPCNCNRCHRQGLVFAGFQTMIMEEGHRGPEAFCRALKVCADAGIRIVILDGITDEWRGVLQLVDQVKAKTGGREDGWSTGRPLHNAFERAVQEYPGHVFATCRAKRESRHKKSELPSDVIPDQDSNVVYRYDVAVFFKKGHGYVVKTRDDRLENVSSLHPGADLAEGLKRWFDDPRAKTQSAAGEHKATAPRAEQVPETAPNTRTDVANQDPTTRSEATQSSASTENGTTEFWRGLVDKIDTALDVGLDDMAAKARAWVDNNRTRRGAEVAAKGMGDTLDKAIREELRRVENEDAQERESMQQEEPAGATAGFSDLPF